MYLLTEFIDSLISRDSWATYFEAPLHCAVVRILSCDCVWSNVSFVHCQVLKCNNVKHRKRVKYNFIWYKEDGALADHR